MSRRTAVLVAWPLVALGAVLVLIGMGMKVAAHDVSGWHFVATDLIVLGIFVASAVVGGLVASRLPSNPIGWIFVGLVVSLGLGGCGDGYVELASDHGWIGGLAAWAAWYTAYSFVVLFAAFLYTLLLFPSGRLLTRRWRIVFWAGTVGLLLFGAAVMLMPGEIEGYPRYTNPIGVDNPFISALGLPGIGLFCLALIGSAVSVVLRFRRAHGVERQQLALLVVAGLFATTTFVASWFVESFGLQDLGIAITLLGIFSIPVAIGVAMLRYRLYEIDRVISRTLVYGALTVILGVAYTGLVLAGQALFSSFAGGSNLAIAVSTLVVAALFLPLRSRVQRVVDRRFYRRKYDAQRTLETFGARLREQVELDRLRADLQTVVRETVQPVHVSVWLRREARP